MFLFLQKNNTELPHFTNKFAGSTYPPFLIYFTFFNQHLVVPFLRRSKFRSHIFPLKIGNKQKYGLGRLSWIIFCNIMHKNHVHYLFLAIYRQNKLTQHLVVPTPVLETFLPTIAGIS